MTTDYQKALSCSGLALRPHQISGIEKVLLWHSAKHGGIVADEMGLGKTCQIVAVINILSKSNKSTRNLVISPLSVIEHWETELKRFGLGEISVVIYRGSVEERQRIRKQLETEAWTVLLTTPTYIIYDSYYFCCFKFTALFFDEAHRLKSSECLLYSIIRQMKMDWVVLLTGTPIQNNLNELYSLLTLVDEDKFPLRKTSEFLEEFKDMASEEVTQRLRTLLETYLLRRTINDAAIKIPPSMQVVLYHGITKLQKRLYREILLKNKNLLKQLVEQNGNNRHSIGKMSLRNIMMELRKCVLHPYLFEGIEPEPFREGEHLVEASGKMLVLDRLLKFLRAGHHRVLIFSQMTRVLDILQDFLTYKKISHERLDGKIRAEERYAAINRFQESSAKTFCFLLSTRAGGLGLTLTGADTVIFLDSDFNPQNDIQAAARCHRIGQTKPVKVIRLVAKHTVEEVIYRRAIKKLRMTNQVLGSNESEGKNLTVVEISEMIGYGLGKLYEKNSKNQLKYWTNRELEEIIGHSTNGIWETEDSYGDLSHSNTEKNSSCFQFDNRGEVLDWHVFEGHNYREHHYHENVKALQELLDIKKSNDAIVLPAYNLRSSSPMTKPSLLEQKRKRNSLNHMDQENVVRKKRVALC